MNNKPNTVYWEVGDIVIHDADEKSEHMLMRVTETGCEFGMTRTEYVNDPPDQYLNDLKYLLDPRSFGIDISGSAPSDIYKRALDKWGVHVQTDIFIEEAAEAIQAISHYRRGRCDMDAVCGELADVWIMLSQMRIVYGENRFDRILADKISALDKKLSAIEKGL